MPGVYTSGEFTDDYGTDWKIDIYDTTYGSGIVYPFTPASNGFTRTYEGITDKPLFTPAYKSRITAKIQITENDGAIEALITDIANGKEDQFYMLVYKDTGSGYNLWFAGMILCDLCQYDDLERFVFEITATDGFNRLENFDYPIDDAIAIAVDGFISELDAIRLGLQICGIERFYGTTDYYIGCAINWHEVDQAKIKTSLVETRVSLDSFIENWEENRPKRALKVIEEIVQTYGAQIRFEGGMWRITQVETQNAATIDYEFYNKSGALEATATEAIEVAIDSSGNKTNDVILNMFLPSLYGVVTTVKEDSKHMWGISEDIVSPATLDESVVVDSVDAYVISVDVGYVPFSSAATPTTRVYFRIIRNGYRFIRPLTGVIKNTWITTGSFNPALHDDVYREFVNENLYFVRRNFSFVVPPPPGAAVGQTMSIKTFIADTTSGTTQDWTSYTHKLSDYWEGKTERDLSFVATNTIVGAASVFLEEKLAYCDSERDFVYAQKRIYNGVDWVPSIEWESGTSATSGKPFAEFLCAKAVYFQRFPRALIQGSLILPQYDSIVSVTWRSRRFMMLNASFDAKAARWGGVWLEMLEQSSDVVSAPVNPYRDQFANQDKRIGDLEFITNKQAYDISQNGSDIFRLNKVNPMIIDTDTVLEAEQTGILVSNDGATVNIKVTLPVWELGLKYRIESSTATYTVEVVPDGGDSSSIYMNGNSGTSLISTVIGTVEIAATSTDKWVVMAVDNYANWTLT